MRHVIRVSLAEDKEKEDNLIYYQLIAKVIQKTLVKIVDKMKKDIALTNGDQVTIYELAFTFYVVINQANNFSLSNLDLVKEHISNEKRIYYNIKADLPHSIILSEYPKEGPTHVEKFKEHKGCYKCEYETKFNYEADSSNPKDF